jgi:phage host-nuclease inhibitor protein Gam
MKRIKAQPITTRSEFLAIVTTLAQLEAQRRQIDAARDLQLQSVNLKFDAQLAPVAEKIKGQFALAEAYADTHRDELLPKDAKSVEAPLARYGWRTGNRTVKLLARVTEENAIAALKAQGLDGYVLTTESLARSLILADCSDDKTLKVAIVRPGGIAQNLQVALSDVGLKIAQAETFFIEPKSDSDAAQTLTPATAAS